MIRVGPNRIFEKYITMKFMALVASGFLFLFLFLVGLLVVTAVWKRRSRDGLTTTAHAACNCATNADGLAVFGT